MNSNGGSGWRILGWALYAVFALLCTFVVMMETGPWFTLALVLVFVFGPKLWKRL